MGPSRPLYTSIPVKQRQTKLICGSWLTTWFVIYQAYMRWQYKKEVNAQKDVAYRMLEIKWYSRGDL